jgi:fatty acid desaturase
MSLLIGLPFPLLRSTHLRHHRALGAADDPEAAVYRAAWWQLPLVLPMVPLLYARSFGQLPRRLQAATALHLALVAGAALWLGPLALGWAVPAVLAIAWFGFTTVYVPHSRHAGSLMKLLQLHSGWHHDHHSDVRFPYPQYAQLRAWNLGRAQERDRVTEWLARPLR